MFSISKPNQASFQAAFKEAMQKANAEFKTQGQTSVLVSIKFFFPRPKKHFLLNEHTGNFHLSSLAPTFVTKTPDIDNCVKLVLDALQGIICSNDSEVCEVNATKLFDHTHTVWNDNKTAVGRTLIKIAQLDEGTTAKDCTCLSCKQKRKIKSNN